MKYISLITCLVVLSLQAQAKPMSSCHHACFQNKYQCNISKSHTFNNCDQELSDCRIGCESQAGKKQYVATTTFPLDISF